ncbi:MAG: VOC family protein [Caulobacteraceae bacterium]
MRFNGICLVTNNVDKLRKFYEDILCAESKGDEDFSLLTVCGAKLSIFSEEGMEFMAPGCMKGSGSGRYTIEFEVEDVDMEYERLKTKNIQIVKPPTTQTWGRRSVWFRDPDGNIINFYCKVRKIR